MNHDFDGDSCRRCGTSSDDPMTYSAECYGCLKDEDIAMPDVVAGVNLRERYAALCRLGYHQVKDNCDVAFARAMQLERENAELKKCVANLERKLWLAG